MNKKQLVEAFKGNDIDVDEKEFDKMLDYMMRKKIEEEEDL